MGIVSSTLDSFNLNNDYGVQASNRTHIFNVAYSYNFGDLVRNKVAGGFVNGWQVSGITQVQSGANLTGQRGQNFGMALNSCKIPGHHLEHQQHFAAGHAEHHAIARS